MRVLFTVTLAISFVLCSFARQPQIPAEEKLIQVALLEKARYDAPTEAHYIFDSFQQERRILEVASRNNIFFATPHTLVLFLQHTDQVNKAKNLGYELIPMAKDVYQIKFTGDEFETMTALRKIFGDRHVLPSYVGHTSACTVYNDTHLQTPTTANTQWHIADKPWLANASQALTHDLDSVETLKALFGLNANQVMINFYDTGVDSANAEFTGRIAWSRNFQSFTNTVTPDDHATGIGYHIFANANNNNGGVGMYGDKQVKNIRDLDCGGLNTIFLYAIYDALDSMISIATNNPTQKQVHNFSFNIANDPIIQSKIQTLKAMQGGTQNFFVASVGNSGNGSNITYPAAFPEVFGVGAVDDALAKPIWAGSSTGQEVDWVAEGGNIAAPGSNWAYSPQSGTSFSSGIVAGALANFLRLQNGINSDTVRYYFDKGSYDLGSTGKDTVYGSGYLSIFKTLEKYCVQPFPTNFNAANNPLYNVNFTPRFFNTNLITARRCYYPNGNQAVPTNNAGVVSFNIIMNSSYGFTATNNVLRYEMDFPNGCTITFYSNPFNIQNMVTIAPPPPIPVIINVDAQECEANPIQIGKIMNPTGTVTITLDSNPITFNSTDSTFNYPVGTAGNHTIEVTFTNTGGTNFKDTLFNTTAAVTPAISITTAQTTICPGATATFNASIQNGGSAPVYQWKLNNVNVGTNTNTYSSSTLANGDIVTCVLTSNATCKTSATATSNSLTMTVAGFTSPALVISTPNLNICSGVPITFTGTPTNGGTAPVYQWKVNNINVGTNSSTFTTSTLTNGAVVNCVMTSNAFCLTTTTATSNNLTMTVTTTVTPTISIATNGTSICAGSSKTFTATATNGGITPSYQWKVNGFIVGTNSTTYSTSTLANGDIVTCTFTSSLACVTAASVNSNSISMTVSPLVTPTISIAESANNICAGTSITFTSSITNGGSAPTYQWKLNNINVGTNSSSYINSTLVNGDIVTCVMTSNASCAVTNVANSNAISMTIVSNTPAVSITTPVTDICVGDNVTFTATPTNGGTTPSYQWKINNVNAGTNSTTFTPAVINNGDVFTCVMTSNEICLTSPTATSNAITMTVNPYVSPSITISTPSLITCAGDSIVFTAVATNGGPSPTYQWRLNGGNVGTNSPYYGNNTLTTGDFIRCRVTSNANCLLNTNANSNILTMTVNPNGTPTITITSSITNGTTGVPITYNAVTNVPSPYTIKWIRNGSFVTYTPVPVWNTFMLSSSDTVEAWIIPNSGCYAPDSVLSNRLFIKNVTNLNHIEIEGLSLYPNPANDLVNINGLLLGDEIRLVDMVGKTIIVSNAINNTSKELNIQQLSNGIYFIRLQRDNKSQLFKLIKE